ncbi:helix-turn-helix domain-containing protein [Tsukamurella sp. 8F]|uniref:helix-turn-helix domain-containing protein n=1 Tax=unclassified Tsukamurella TaxID=2633480 RepID=UPI0023BA2D28|nr:MULTISPECIES: helix-turn-helix domain-containing protein [unclassified Tsukamurella]MDF0531780.1 helix-turn-helix domain-containing protein [Tsukamurella sp. 8J]MDF0588018.1 helix-turn-helix domain-containing protein [Tsukamurella sp. 8F]
MQGLMYRLAELDADSAGLVRVIDYFDTLVRHGGDVAAMLRAAAALADCTVGVDVSGFPGVKPARCDERGRWQPHEERKPSTSADVVVSDHVVGTVWIERRGPALPLDEMLVDRMALTTAIILAPRSAPTAADHTRDLLFPMDDVSALTACSALGLGPDSAVRVAATDQVRTKGIAPAGRSCAIAVDGTVLIVVSADVDSKTSARVGLSLSAPAAEIAGYVDNARFARAQATADNPVVLADELGALCLIAPGRAVPREAVPDLARATELARTPHGAELVDTLRVYLASGTLRSAAERIHLHHSTVAHRLGRLSAALGFAVDTVQNRARATAMLMALAHIDGR